MTVSEYLDQHKLLTVRIEKDQESLSFLCPAIADPHAPQPSLDRVQVSSAGDAPFVANLEYIAGLKERIESEKEVLRRLTDEIQQMFSVLDPYAYILMSQHFASLVSRYSSIISLKSCMVSSGVSPPKVA